MRNEYDHDRVVETVEFNGSSTEIILLKKWEISDNHYNVPAFTTRDFRNFKLSDGRIVKPGAMLQKLASGEILILNN